MQRRPPHSDPTRGHRPGHRRPRLALALSLGAFCIAACEYSQILFITPSAASSLGIEGQLLLTCRGSRAGPSAIAPPQSGAAA
jgi:hypothetical protein